MMKAFLLFILLGLGACGYTNAPSNYAESKDTSKMLTADTATSASSVSSNQVDKEDNQVTIDSVSKGPGIMDYILLYHSNNKTHEVYRVENQDNSLEFRKKYSLNTQKQHYACYEVVDLPTGITWNIFYDKLNHAFFITDKYDLEALGDTIEQKSVNFKSKTATVISEVNKKSYTVNLKRIWPK